MGKLIAKELVSTRNQSTDRQAADLLDAGVRRDDLYVDHGVSDARARRPQFDLALAALHKRDTLVITTFDRLGRSTVNMLTLADELKSRGAALRVLNLGGASVDTSTPTGSMVFTVMAALAQMELEIKCAPDRRVASKPTSSRTTPETIVHGGVQGTTPRRRSRLVRGVDCTDPANEASLRRPCR